MSEIDDIKRRRIEDLQGREVIMLIKADYGWEVSQWLPSGGVNMRTLIQILGWIEHCERDHQGEPTTIPSWLCSQRAFEEAETDGYIEVKGSVSIVPRLGLTGVVYGLTDKGRGEFFAALPRN